MLHYAICLGLVTIQIMTHYHIANVQTDNLLENRVPHYKADYSQLETPHCQKMTFSNINSDHRWRNYYLFSVAIFRMNSFQFGSVSQKCFVKPFNTNIFQSGKKLIPLYFLIIKMYKQYALSSGVQEN